MLGKQGTIGAVDQVMQDTGDASDALQAWPKGAGPTLEAGVVGGAPLARPSPDSPSVGEQLPIKLDDPAGWFIQIYVNFKFW